MTRQMQDSSFGLRCFLVLVALFEVFDATLDLPLIIDRPNLLFGPWAVVPTTLMGILLAKTYVIVHPTLAIAALTFSANGNIRGALIALGAISILTWLSFLPAILEHGLPLEDWRNVQWTVAQLVVFPLLAGVAITLAVRTRRYWLAAALLGVATAYNAFGMLLFVVNVVVANI